MNVLRVVVILSLVMAGCVQPDEDIAEAVLDRTTSDAQDRDFRGTFEGRVSFAMRIHGPDNMIQMNVTSAEAAAFWLVDAESLGFSFVAILPNSPQLVAPPMPEVHVAGGAGEGGGGSIEVSYFGRNWIGRTILVTVMAGTSSGSGAFEFVAVGADLERVGDVEFGPARYSDTSSWPGRETAVRFARSGVEHEFRRETEWDVEGGALVLYAMTYIQPTARRLHLTLGAGDDAWEFDRTYETLLGSSIGGDNDTMRGGPYPSWFALAAQAETGWVRIERSGAAPSADGMFITPRPSFFTTTLLWPNPEMD